MTPENRRGGGSGRRDEDIEILRGRPRAGDGPAPPPPSRREAGGASPQSPPASPAAPPPDAPPSGEAPADLAAALESVATAGRRLDAILDEATAVLASIREHAAGFEEMRRSVTEAAQFTGDTRAATAVLQAEAGKQIEGLKDGRAGLDRAVAALGSRAEGLKAGEGSLGEAVGEVRAVWKRASEVCEQLASETATLANNYRNWTSEAAAHREGMASLSQEIRQGGAGMRESVAKNTEAQLEISVKTLGNAEKFSRENGRFLKRFEANGDALLETVRREWAATRRWAVPALSAALILAVPSFAAVGALAQSEFRVFEPSDETDGWKQFVWDRHGERVRACLVESWRAEKVLGCRLRVDGRELRAAPAARLPPLPARG